MDIRGGVVVVAIAALTCALPAAVRAQVPAASAAPPASKVASGTSTAVSEAAARAHFARGQALYRDGKWSEALDEFRAGYALDPRPEFLINIAQTERRLGRVDAALESCDRFLERASGSPLAAQVHELMKELRADQARARAQAAARLGATLVAAGQYERALDAYQRAYLDDIDEASYLLRIAECYRALGRAGEAQRFYRLYLKERPNAPERADVEAKLRAFDHPVAAATPPVTAATRPVAAPSPSVAAPPPSVAAPPVVASEPAPPTRADRPLWRRWWLWTAIGGAVAIAVGVGVGVALGTRGSGNGAFMPTLPSFGPSARPLEPR